MHVVIAGPPYPFLFSPKDAISENIEKKAADKDVERSQRWQKVRHAIGEWLVPYGAVTLFDCPSLLSL